MVLKTIDSKEKDIALLNKLLSQSNSNKQKELIKKEIKFIEQGYKSEKENAYFLDFHFEGKEHIFLLHDIRIEYKGRVAQLDHILIAPLGITILESKSFTGILTIKEDKSLYVDYGKYVKTFTNPIEQNIRHEKVLKEFLADNISVPQRIKMMGGIPIEHKVLIHPNTTVTNKKLPEGFERGDAFATQRNREIDHMGPVKVLKAVVTFITKEFAEEIAQTLIQAHKPISYNWEKKYRIGSRKSNDTEVIKKETKVNEINMVCPRCNEGKLVQRQRKSKKFGSQYKSDKFLGCSKFPKCRYTEEIEI